ncbi:hypothetical protein M4D55_19790 [Metabacillus idriensis]|uniref:hypothetical protein n=1 Tax=Metabacillus idriensis TaxID=324768 RepID=UPI00203C7936|nr:hypothetical protein [Metabacillus idriensis]MCM3598009.1 hypothetical protein [Metabacillus idriensis]
MFGWDLQNSKSDRIKLFLFLLVVFLIVGFATSTFFRGTLENSTGVSQTVETTQPPSDNTNSKDSTDVVMHHKEVPNEYDQTEHFTEEDLSKSKVIAVKFTKAFHAYDAEKPTDYLSMAKPFMTNALFEKMKRNGRREVLERSYLNVHDTEVTPVSNKSSTVVRWNVIVRGEARSIDGKLSSTEDWYLVGLREAEGEWMVEDVRVNVPN